MALRKASVNRKTKETEVKVRVRLDGKGMSKVETGVKFLDHMITTLSTHSLFDIYVRGKGNLRHHLVEDVAISLGRAVAKALGDREGIFRFGYSVIPMDCALATVAVDLVKRPYCVTDLKIEGKKIEDIPVEEISHFIYSFTTSLEANIHMLVHYGSNNHHKIEACLKALALSLRQASTIDSRRKGIPSAKGVEKWN